MLKSDLQRLTSRILRGLLLVAATSSFSSCSLGPWQNDIVDFVETGLSACYITSSSYVQGSQAANADVVHGSPVTVTAEIYNPKNLRLSYTVSCAPSLIEDAAMPVIADTAGSVDGYTTVQFSLDADFVLTADIDLSGTSWTPIGNASDPFTGTFDGGGHTISGITFSLTNTEHTGLFGCIGADGTVQNLTLKDPQLNGFKHLGGIAGENHGTIYRCAVTGSNPIDGTGWVGGIAGQNFGTIEECYSSIPVSSSSWYVGGLVGSNFGKISNCYARGSVSASGKDIGGLVGLNETTGTISMSYSTGAVSGSTFVGGLVGLNDNTASGCIANCFYDSTTSGRSDTGKGTPCTTTQMQSEGIFSDALWDFMLIWDSSASENDAYPYLRNLTP